MRVNILKSIKSSVFQETELDKIASIMQSSQKLCNMTQQYREQLESVVEQADKKALKEQKIKKFPAFTPCASFYDGRTRQDVIGLTGLCFLDIDQISDEKQLLEAMDILRKDPHVVMASRSLSGNGLHILIRYRVHGVEVLLQRVTMTPDKMQRFYAKVYLHIATMYQQKLGQEMDSSSGHMEHLHIISYDPELYYNPNAEALVIE